MYAAAFVTDRLRIAKESSGLAYVLNANATQRMGQAAFRLSFAVRRGVFSFLARRLFFE